MMETDYFYSCGGNIDNQHALDQCLRITVSINNKVIRRPGLHTRRMQTLHIFRSGMFYFKLFGLSNGKIDSLIALLVGQHFVDVGFGI